MSNKSIILTETELKTIIKDTVNETLNSYQKNLMNDFRQIFHPASFDNPLTYLMRKPIEEGITKTYPIDITIRYINEYFNKYHLNVFIRKGSTLTKDEKIIIEFPNTNDNFNIINKALNLCGYYLGFPKEDEIIKNKNLWLTLEYEPRHQSDDTKQAIKSDKFLRPKNNNEGHWYKVTKTPVLNRYNQVVSIVVIFENIDADKNLEERKKTFVATMTHDLKTPTLAQINALDLLLTNCFGEVSNIQRDILNQIKSPLF